MQASNGSSKRTAPDTQGLCCLAIWETIRPVFINGLAFVLRPTALLQEPQIYAYIRRAQFAKRLAFHDLPMHTCISFQPVPARLLFHLIGPLDKLLSDLYGIFFPALGSGRES